MGKSVLKPEQRELLKKKMQEKKNIVKENKVKTNDKKQIQEKIKQRIEKKKQLEEKEVIKERIKQKIQEKIKNQLKEEKISKKEKLLKRIKENKQLREQLSNELQKGDYGVLPFNHVDVKRIQDKAGYEDKYNDTEFQLIQNVKTKDNRDVQEKLRVLVPIMDEIQKSSEEYNDENVEWILEMIDNYKKSGTFGEQLVILFREYIFGNDVVSQLDQLREIFGMDQVMNVIFRNVTDQIEEGLMDEMDEEYEPSQSEIWDYMVDYFMDNNDEMYDYIEEIGEEKYQFFKNDLYKTIQEYQDYNGQDFIFFVKDEGNPDLLLFFI